MTKEQLDLDPKYLAALEASLEHWRDGKNRTKDSWEDFECGCIDCAVCGYFGYTALSFLKKCKLPDCIRCFLDDSGKGDRSCSDDWKVVNNAVTYKVFHEAATALYNRILAERDRVKAIQEWYAKQQSKPPDPLPKSAHEAGKVFDDEWEYVGELRVPENDSGVWYVSYAGKADKGIVDMDINNGYREILRPRKKPKTKVTVWAKLGTNIKGSSLWGWRCVKPEVYVGEYSFTGTPDIRRIIKETLKQGALAVKVESTEKFPADKANIFVTSCYIWKSCIETGFGGWYNSPDDAYKQFYSDSEDSDIEAAITAWLEKEKKESPITEKWTFAKSEPAAPKITPNIIKGDDGNLYELGTGGGLYKPPAPEFYVGEIVVVDDELCRVEKVDCGVKDVFVVNRIGDGWYKTWDCNHHATLDEIETFYTSGVGGHKVRAYEDEDGDIRVSYLCKDGGDDFMVVYCETEIEIMRSFCESAHLPIMPNDERRRLYGDKYPAPKEATR